MGEYAVLIRDGQVLDGSGAPARRCDVAIDGDRIAAVGELGPEATAELVIDATGMTVAPGFVNMLSHAHLSLLQDGRGMADLMQGVTTEVFSEEPPVGPTTAAAQARTQASLDAAGYDRVRVSWTDVAGYLDALESQGIGLNACTFMSTWALRDCAMGLENRPPTGDEMRTMVRIVEESMEAGAFGIGSAMIYPPATYTTTDELVELCTAAARHGGRYHSHLRSEGAGLFAAMDELLEIARRADIPVEHHHLKIAGQENWHTIDEVLERLESARRTLPVSANMYTFNAGGTAVHSAIPARFHDGGPDKLRERLHDPAIRAEIRAEIESGGGDWENLYRMSGGGGGVMLLGALSEPFASLCGKTLEEIGAQLGTDPIEVLMDISMDEHAHAGAAYFIISEDNVRRQVQVPWITFGSDASAAATEPPFTNHPTHPREYANVARLLGHYVRDEGLLSLSEAVRRLSSLPCETLGLRQRGRLEEGWFADVVVFDAETVAGVATYQDSHRYATGMRDVFVNGVATLRDGAPTGAMPGLVIRHGGALAS